MPVMSFVSGGIFAFFVRGWTLNERIEGWNEWIEGWNERIEGWNERIIDVDDSHGSVVPLERGFLLVPAAKHEVRKK